MNGQFETMWMAAEVERSLELKRAERLGGLGWRPGLDLSWLPALRRLVGRRPCVAGTPRPARRAVEREEAMARPVPRGF